MPQIQRYSPPPNPAKVSDPRAGSYITKYGNTSWELDALEPRVIVELIVKAVKMFRDETKWIASLQKEKSGREMLTELGERWKEVIRLLKTSGKPYSWKRDA
jgi:hypothetical protein